MTLHDDKFDDTLNGGILAEGGGSKKSSDHSETGPQGKQQIISESEKPVPDGIVAVQDFLVSRPARRRHRVLEGAEFHDLLSRHGVIAILGETETRSIRILNRGFSGPSPRFFADQDYGTRKSGKPVPLSESVLMKEDFSFLCEGNGGSSGGGKGKTRVVSIRRRNDKTVSGKSGPVSEQNLSMFRKPLPLSQTSNEQIHNTVGEIFVSMYRVISQGIMTGKDSLSAATSEATERMVMNLWIRQRPYATVAIHDRDGVTKDTLLLLSRSSLSRYQPMEVERLISMRDNAYRYGKPDMVS